jgi:hypothetical protein
MTLFEAFKVTAKGIVARAKNKVAGQIARIAQSATPATREPMRLYAADRQGIPQLIRCVSPKDSRALPIIGGAVIRLNDLLWDIKNDVHRLTVAVSLLGVKVAELETSHAHNYRERGVPRSEAADDVMDAAVELYHGGDREETAPTAVTLPAALPSFAAPALGGEWSEVVAEATGNIATVPDQNGDPVYGYSAGMVAGEDQNGKGDAQ